MDGYGITRPDLFEKEMRRTASTVAGSHVILGMHLEPADIRSAIENVTVVLGLQPGSRAEPLQPTIRRHGTSSPYMGANVPLRFMPSFSVTSMAMQDPLATYFHAFAS